MRTITLRGLAAASALKWFLIALALPARLVCQNPPPTAPLGDVFESGTGNTPGDVFVSDNPRDYVVNGIFDRCAWDKAHIPKNPLSLQYGMPDHVPVDSFVMEHYVKCGEDACSQGTRAVCWGWKKRGNPQDQGEKDPPKNLTRTESTGRGPRQKSIPPIDNQMLISRIDNCLRDHSKLVYYSSPDVKPSDDPEVKVRYANSTIVYNPGYLATVPPYERVWLLAIGFALHVENLEKQRYRILRSPQKLLGEVDLIVGFVSNCMVDLSPDDPREPYDNFLHRLEGLDDTAIRPRENDFTHGWNLYGAALPRELTHEPPVSEP